MSIFVLVWIITITGILTWWMSERWIYRKLQKEVIEMEKCPFKTPCLKYDDVQTKDAVRRVAKLIIENMEKEELGKRKLYENLASGKLG